MDEARVIRMMKHLQEVNNGEINLLERVKISEDDDIMRLGQEFERRLHEVQDIGKDTERMRKEHEKGWKEKTTHKYLQRQIDQNKNVDQKATAKWLQLRLLSHVEGYIMAAQKQEIDTKETRKRREKDPEKKRSMDTRYRICHQHNQSTFHSVCFCPIPAATLYLNSRHSQVARVVCHEIIESCKPIYNPPSVTTRD